MALRIIAGIGNPEPEYAGTRHNLGFEVIKKLSSRLGIPVCSEKFLALWGAGSAAGTAVGLMMPQTFVNNSGFAVKSVCDFYELSPSSILVITDDLNLPPGKIRFRKKGSSGGHNGLRSIIEVCQTEWFPRLRIGIGPGNGPDVISHVLGRYEGDEKILLDSAVDAGTETALSWISSPTGFNINANN